MSFKIILCNEVIPIDKVGIIFYNQSILTLQEAKTLGKKIDLR